MRASYGVASTYVLADTYDKAAKMSRWGWEWRHLARVPGSQAGEVAVAAVDTLLWQAFASVIVPGGRGKGQCWAWRAECSVVDAVLEVQGKVQC